MKLSRLVIIIFGLVWLVFYLPVRVVRSKQTGDSQVGIFEKTIQPFFADNCYSCHSSERQSSGLDLESYSTSASFTKDKATMALILRKLTTGAMPPPQMPRPKQVELQAVTEWIGQQLDGSIGAPIGGTSAGKSTEINPGRVTARRLNRTEYNNTVRDLLGVDIYPADDFPQDDSGYGFDNIGDVLSLSPILMEKYISASEKISRNAVFGPELLKPTLMRLRTPERNFVPQMTPPGEYDLTGLSLSSAIQTSWRVPVNGEYVIRANLSGDRPAGSEPIQIALWIDGQQVEVKGLDPAAIASFAQNGEPQELWAMSREFRAKLSAGDHWLAVSIPHQYEGLPPTYNGPNPSKRPIPPPPVFKPPPGASPEEIEKFKKVFDTAHARRVPANGARIGSIEIGGPYAIAKGPSDETLKKIFICGHPNGHHNPGCVRAIIARLAHRAYRRPVAPQEIDQLTSLSAKAQKESGSFEEGLSVGIEAVLLSPHFLFRIERDPSAARINGATSAHPLTQHELASRLSYFLWSSMPDDALLKAADSGQLSKPSELEAQVRRMLQDPKSNSLAQNFAGQWLEVRKLESVKPDRKRFPDFDDYLRRSMGRETELFFQSIIHEDRSILDFIDAKYTFLNERLARFYQIPGVEGPEFRKVQLTADAHRSGILTQASVLTVSSYATRTSPVLRGKWVLGNLLDAAPPPPPPDVPNLDEAKIGSASTLREQLEQHRKNATCASCHSRMDPLGFGLENFDAIGAWRTKDGQFPIDSSGTLPDGRTFSGLQGLESILKGQPDAFSEALTRKLLIYALGRGLEHYDDPSVKKIVKAVAANNYHFSTLILEIVKSAPFQMRKGEGLQ